MKTHPTPRRAQRGMTLVEALVAFAVASVGMLAAVAAQSNLRSQADGTRQRAEAVQLAEEALEQIRSLGSAADAASAADTSARADALVVSNTRYTITRSLQWHDAPRHADADVTVRWTGQDGHDTAITLHSVVSAIDPALSGRLLSPSANALQSAPLGRSIAIPMHATDLGDGHSAWAPPGSHGMAWVFDNRSGQPLATCALNGTSLTASALSDCQAAHGHLITGHVRFATGPTLSIADALSPGSAALPVQMSLQLTEGDASATHCFAAQPVATSPGDLAYACLVAPDANTGQWSGRLDVNAIGWTIGADAESDRVCRYSADRDHDGLIENLEHPLDYVHVGHALTQQNFLVVRGDQPCPVDLSSPASTVEQSPSPTPTPLG